MNGAQLKASVVARTVLAVCDSPGSDPRNQVLSTQCGRITEEPKWSPFKPRLMAGDSIAAQIDAEDI